MMDFIDAILEDKSYSLTIIPSIKTIHYHHTILITA